MPQPTGGQSGVIFDAIAANKGVMYDAAGNLIAAGVNFPGVNTWSGTTTTTGPSTFTTGPVLSTCALTIPEGTNAYMGTIAVNGVTAVTVSTTAISANSRIFVTTQAPAGTPGAPYVFSQSVATFFTLKSTGASDTSTVAWLIINHT